MTKLSELVSQLKELRTALEKVARDQGIDLERVSDLRFPSVDEMLDDLSAVATEAERPKLQWGPCLPLPGFADVDFWRERYEVLSKASRIDPLAWSEGEPE